MRQQGAIVKWDSDKGFGFIRSDHSSDDAFAHIKSFRPSPRTPPAPGLRVTYSLKLNAQNGLQALQIQAEGEAYTHSIPPLALYGTGVRRRMTLGDFINATSFSAIAP